MTDDWARPDGNSQGVVPPLYDRIGAGYDTTRRADPYLADRFADLLGIRADGVYLDVACGTGNYTTALSGRGGRWCGLDRSGTMLATARTKGARVRWLHGDAARVPFPDRALDGAICTLALHHMRDHPSVFGETRRVLAGGSFVVFTSDPELMRGYWLNRYFPETMRRAIDQMPPIELVERALRAAGFARINIELYAVRPDLADLCLFAGKHRPGMYLDPRVWAGISAFANLAPPEDVERGLTQFARDGAYGAIGAVIRDGDTGRGEYLYDRATC